MDKARQANIETHLISMRIDPRLSPPTKYPSFGYTKKSFGTDDPFIQYQEGWISKRKLIEYIAKHIVRTCE
jgi:hypothetical protein